MLHKSEWYIKANGYKVMVKTSKIVITQAV